MVVVLELIRSGAQEDHPFCLVVSFSGRWLCHLFLLVGAEWLQQVCPSHEDTIVFKGRRGCPQTSHSLGELYHILFSTPITSRREWGYQDGLHLPEMIPLELGICSLFPGPGGGGE